ncbi:hypothetical protein OSB04_011166 [Centaurea solstitialis]|uniref:Uncharacterized protein n=1 Tax=Centaurea solstitialis TaxID=347529 RepID=A0AA38WCN7_9ASTR|nr:hypothetical protein OSB04_011166 [Centaurea solstitialis]
MFVWIFYEQFVIAPLDNGIGCKIKLFRSLAPVSSLHGMYIVLILCLWSFIGSLFIVRQGKRIFWKILEAGFYTSRAAKLCFSRLEASRKLGFDRKCLAPPNLLFRERETGPDEFLLNSSLGLFSIHHREKLSFSKFSHRLDVGSCLGFPTREDGGSMIDYGGDSGECYAKSTDMEDYDGIPDDDVPMWVLRKRQHESTLKELLEKPMANRSSLQQKVNRPYVKSEDFNSSLILQDETMDEQSDDRPYWGLKEQDWEDRIRDVGSLADSLRKMREESERVRESMKKSEWLTHSTIQPQVSCPSFKVNNDSNEKFLLGQDSYSKMEVEDTWFGNGVELSLQEDSRPNDKIEEPPTRMINSMDQPVIEKLAPPIEDSWIQHEVIPPWSDSDDSDEEFSWQVNTTEEYHDDDCLDGLGALMQDDLPEEASSDQTPPQQTVSPPLINKDESNNGLSFSQGIPCTVQGVLAQDPFWEASCQKQLVNPTSLTTYLKDLRPNSRKFDVHSARRHDENRYGKWCATLPGGSHKGKSVSPGFGVAVSLLSKSDKFLKKTDLQQTRQENILEDLGSWFLHFSRREGDVSRREALARAAKLCFSRLEASRKLGFDRKCLAPPNLPFRERETGPDEFLLNSSLGLFSIHHREKLSFSKFSHRLDVGSCLGFPTREDGGSMIDYGGDSGECYAKSTGL